MTDSLARARELRTPGEDAWIDEIIKASVGYDVPIKLATILRAYRANLLTQQAALLDTAVREARVQEAEWFVGEDGFPQHTSEEHRARLRSLKEGEAT